MTPPHILTTTMLPLEREYTLSKINSYLGLIEKSAPFAAYNTMYSSLSSIAYAALTILKISPSMSRSVFRQPLVANEMDSFVARVSHVNDILLPCGLHTSRPKDDMRDSKTSIVRNLRSFYRDIEKNYSMFSEEDAYTSMLVIARYVIFCFVSHFFCLARVDKQVMYFWQIFRLRGKLR